MNSNDITTGQDLLANLAGTISNISEKFWTNSPQDKDWLDYTGDTVFVIRTYRQNDWAGFFKDNWKIKQNFTLNLGLRWSYYDGKIPAQSGGGGKWFPVTSYPEIDPGFS